MYHIIIRKKYNYSDSLVLVKFTKMECILVRSFNHSINSIILYINKFVNFIAFSTMSLYFN